MKKITIYILALAALLNFAACSEDDLDSKSIFDTTPPERTEFDNWLIQNFTIPYNIEFKYRMEDIESSITHDLVPADMENSQKMAKLVKHLWLETYDEISGVHFTRKYIPKVIHLVGSAAWNNNNTKVVGSAEGGLKVTLYEINDLVIDIDVLNENYFHTMHHEFAHILHQTKDYDTDYKEISSADYIGINWYQRDDRDARILGFVTPYSMQEANEDFVELFSTYILSTKEQWAAIMAEAGSDTEDDEVVRADKVKGDVIIARKLKIVRDYMQDSWGIDIDKLRDITLRRANEIYLLDLE
jgi:substrate import-associated zinc metallohydrolase lipoprotein